jgi:hypothetical protein
MSKSYYVMQEMDGDECLLFNKPTIDEAIQAAKEYKTINGESLSVWSSDGGIVWMPQTGKIASH